MTALHDTLGAVSALELRGQRYARATVACGRGVRWTNATTVLEDPHALEALLATVLRAARTDRRDVATTFLAQGWAWALAAPAVAAVTIHRRLPSLDLDGTWVCFAGSWLAEATAFPAAPLLVLPDDPARRHAGVVTVEDEPALLRALWAGIRAHLLELAPVLSATSRRPPRALWRVAHDAVADAFVAAGEALGAREVTWAMWARAKALAPIELAFNARPVLVELPDPGAEPRPVLARAGCCLAYRTDAEPRPCAGCPLTPAAERGHRLALTMAETTSAAE